ncbi:MAG TPA: DNA polymerase III subunit gamma/tau [Candidatus Eisenbacteria bacterium]|nr:DNA polymerase III subunit gamma/tau [Candidatus Eisenbacteria bacterium]
MVYYRKYRPQTIGELDSPKLRETLTAVLSQKEIPHAFLFTGPKGLGKTSTARIIAKVLNCTAKKRNGIEPCNECSQCVSITNGTNIDVLEIDGASNRGIDEIRELRERVNLAPSAAKKKVYIIDEVHMLTTEAFNALLKTIEEPPSHVVFIFATTEPQKVPNTIISRCFHISLDRATQEELVHSLKRIVKEEKIIIDEEVLNLIANMGDGGYRDTTKILEELVALSNGKKITKEIFEQTHKTANILLRVSTLLQHIIDKDAKASLLEVNELINQGTDIRLFIFQVLSNLHRRLLEEMKVREKEVRPANLEIPLNQLQQLIPLFEKAYQDTKYAVIPSLPLELAIVTYCQKDEIQDSGFKIQEETPEKPVIASEARQSNTSNDSGRNTLKDTRTKEQNLKVKQVLSGTKPEEKKPVESTATQRDLPKNVQDASLLLENLIYKVKPYNHSVAGVLRGCTIGAMDGVAITFTTKYVFHKEKLEEQKVREILEKVVREVTGKQLSVMIELKK